jgi:phenylacetic acid degradation operon negative regulatory protein
MMQERNASLTARSVLASALLGEEPPELPVAHLVRLAGLFGISANRARVALSRMVAAGEATTDGSGRYRLAGHLLDRRQRQAVSRVGDTHPWDGRWRLVVVTTSGRAPEDRLALRRRLTLARLAQRREGVWMRPHNIDLVPDPSDDPHLALFTARPDQDPSTLAAALWDLSAWAGRAGALVADMERLMPTEPDDLAPGFELSAAVLRHLQADPLLPAELVPPAWPGSALRATYEEWDRTYRGALATWGRSR